MLGSIGTAVHRGDIADSVPAGVPAEAADAARDTLGGAVGVADSCRPNSSARLSKRSPRGCGWPQGLSVAVMVGLAVLVVWVLRRERAGESNPAERELAGAQRA